MPPLPPPPVSPEAPPARRRVGLLPPLLAAVVAVAVFAVCLRNQFVYDDVQLLQMDDRLTDPSQWSRYWTESYNGGIDNLYRPLVSTTFALQWATHGLTPEWPWFAVNILLHAVVAALVAVLAGRVARCGPVAAGAAGVIFAVLPAHAEVVASVVGRAESLCAAFFLSAIVLAARPLTVGRSVAVWACAVGALLSKEQGLVLPLVLLLQQWFRPSDERAEQRRGVTAFTLLICWSWAAYIVFRENALKFWWERSLLDPMQQPMIWSHGADRALMPLVLLGRYARLLIWPDTLSLDWGGQVIGWRVSPTDPHLWIGIAVATAWLAGVAVAAWRRRRTALFLLLCVAATYGLIGNAVTLIGTNLGERLIYLPSAFLCVLAGMALGLMRRPTAIVALVGAIALPGAARTIAYVRLFDDRLRLYAAAVEAQPKSVRLRMLLASELVARRQLDEARRAATAAVELQPDYHEAYLMAAVVEVERGDYDAAERLIQRGLAAPTLKNPAKLAAHLQRVRDLRSAARATTQQATTQPTTSPGFSPVVPREPPR